jgi:hypothetical protein
MNIKPSVMGNKKTDSQSSPSVFAMVLLIFLKICRHTAQHTGTKTLYIVAIS